MFNWSADEIRVTIGGLGSFSVMPSFGMPKTRMIQAIASRMGGLLWIHGTDSAGHEASLPVPNPDSRTMAGQGTEEGYASAASMFISAIHDNGGSVSVSVLGGEWHPLSFEFITGGAHTEESQSDATIQAGTVVNGFRRNF